MHMIVHVHVSRAKRHKRWHITNEAIKVTVRIKKNLSIPQCLTTVDIVWSRPLCDRCVTVAGPSLNRSISAVVLYKHGVRRYTIIACAAAASRISGTAVLVRCILKY